MGTRCWENELRISEISGGTPNSLRIRPTDGPFQTVLRRESEVTLLRHSEVLLLACEGAAWAIEGVTPADTTNLEDVVGSGLPMVAFIAQAASDHLVVEVRRFTDERRIVEPMEFGVDEKVLEDVRRVHKVGGTVADITAWLDDRLLGPPSFSGPSELRRFIISGDTQAFRIFGFKVSVDVKLINGKFRVERVLKGGRGGNHRLTLLYAPASFMDATLAAEIHGAVRTALSEATSDSNSYLRIWEEYSKLERETVLRHARAVGCIEYLNCERRTDGGWRFRLSPQDSLESRLELLKTENRIELEAGEDIPKFSEESYSGAVKGGRPEGSQKLTAMIDNINIEKWFIDLAPPDDDEEQPRPPATGYLYLSIGGDETRMRRRERAQEALRTGNCQMPQLGLLMEGRPAIAARRSKVSPTGPLLKPVIKDVFGSAGPTQRQLEAIEVAINTPDVCLIQGPPGTGKTKVISAIGKCLAVLADEGVEPSHRILVTAAQHDAVETVAQRTEIFGLPAQKVGRRRRGSDNAVDHSQIFAKDRIETLRARMKVPLEAEIFSRARHLAVALCRTHSSPSEQANKIRELVQLLGDLLSSDLRDRALERAANIAAPAGAGDVENLNSMLRAARSIRVESTTFADDGPIKARIALRRLNEILSDEGRAFLERCCEVEVDNAPEWLPEGIPLRNSLIDQLNKPKVSGGNRPDDTTQELLIEIVDFVNARISSTSGGVEGAIAAYLSDLENDPAAVREALLHYTVMLASTLHHAAGREMCRLRGIEDGTAAFETIIVDEAARAHPLDLFIPLSMAKRRAVLVGDHRQLPHLLEPDVEQEIDERIIQETLGAETMEAVKASLFERMWVLLRALEDKDGIRRTVTLNAQYRMHPKLGEFVSKTFYEVHEDGIIESPRGPEEFAHDLPGYTKGGSPVQMAWINVPNEGGRDQEIRAVSKRRPAEARAIAKEIRRIIEHDSKLTIGVIAFYSDQVDEIGRAMISAGLTEKTSNRLGWRVSDQWARTYNAEGKNVERLRIGTVDAFQGKEFDVVFLSVTRSNNLPSTTDSQQRKKYGHLMLENRLCVAMSRQQRLLIGVGDRAFVSGEEAKEPLRALHTFSDLCGGNNGVVR